MCSALTRIEADLTQRINTETDTDHQDTELEVCVTPPQPPPPPQKMLWTPHFDQKAILQTNRNTICNAIKQIQFSFLWLIVYIICKAFNRPQWNWSIGSKDMGSYMVVKIIGNKEIICFVWLYVKISICEFQLILLEHIMYCSDILNPSSVWL